MSEYYGLYLDFFESQEAWLYCVIFAAYTTLLNKLLHNKLSKSAKHLNSTVTHCTMQVGSQITMNLTVSQLRNAHWVRLCSFTTPVRHC
jgi:hypothetical protein